MITIFKPTVAPWTSPVYAAMEGVFLGAISQIVELQKFAKAYPGIAHAGGDADGRAPCSSCSSSTAAGSIRVTERLKAGIIMATGALCLFYF